MRSSHQTCSLLAVLLGTCALTTCGAADASNLERRRKAILQEKCGRCHAVGAVGESPLAIAPPMRDICRRYARRELQQDELLEGKVSSHKEMPQIDFSQEDVAAIMAYLYALAVKK